MAGISATQGATVINAGGTASFSVPQTGCITGIDIVFAFTGSAPAGYKWIVAPPVGSAAAFDDDSIASPTLQNVDNPSDAWLVVLNALDSSGNVVATYMLPLSIPTTVQSTYAGPLALPYVVPTAVATPGIGQALYQNASKAGAVTAKDASAVSRQVAIVRSGITASRPSTTNLDVGTTYYDTTIPAPIWWDGVNWVNYLGVTV